MKTNLLTLLLAAWGLTALAQASIPIQFSSFRKVSSHYQKGLARINARTSYQLSLRKEQTSILIKMPIHSSLKGSYVVADGDTLRFSKSTKKDEPVSVSQLLVFKSPTKNLTFYSGALNEYVEFHLYNSGASNKPAPSQTPEPGNLPISQSIAAAFIPNETLLDRHEDLHTDAIISRHPSNYMRKRRKN